MMLLYAAATTLVLSLAAWIAYAVAAFFVLAPFAASFGISEITADIVLGLILLPVPAGVSVWVFRRVLSVERRRAAAAAADSSAAAES